MAVFFSKKEEKAAEDDLTKQGKKHSLLLYDLCEGEKSVRRAIFIWHLIRILSSAITTDILSKRTGFVIFVLKI